MTTEAEKAQGSTTDFIKGNTLKIAGVGALIADTALLTYGAVTKNFKIGSIGALGYTSGTIATRYGNPKQEKQLELVERQLGDYLRNQGVAIPKDPTLETLSKPGGVIDHVEEFIYANPTQLMNICFGLMGVQFTRSGVQHDQKALMASGGLMMAAALSGLLIQEKKPDPEHPPQGALQKTWSWIQEKPLRLTGTLLNLNQLSLAIDTFQERRRNPGKNAYLLKALAVCGFTLCNVMLALSSSSHGGGSQLDAETRDKLSDAAVKIIAVQPKDVQESLFEHIAGFLASQPYVHMKASEISAMLHQKMAEVNKSAPVPSR